MMTREPPRMTRPATKCVGPETRMPRQATAAGAYLETRPEIPTTQTGKRPENRTTRIHRDHSHADRTHTNPDCRANDSSRARSVNDREDCVRAPGMKHDPVALGVSWSR